MSRIDFKALNAHVLSFASSFFPEELPGGKFVGSEYVCSDIRGGSGRSFSINAKTGAWADFSESISGGDVISFYAEKHQLPQKEAAIALGEKFSFAGIFNSNEVQVVRPAMNISFPPIGTLSPVFKGFPQFIHKYCDSKGNPIFYIARYVNKESKKKTFTPYCYDSTTKTWVNRAYPEPRPLYNLHLLSSNPDAQVLIVEGETSADAVNRISDLSKLFAMTWPNGSNSVSKTALSPLYGRKVVLWPDADEAGIKAMDYLAENLIQHCELKRVDVSKLPPAFDAANLITADFSLDKLLHWLKPRVSVLEPEPPPPPTPEIVPPQATLEFVDPELEQIPQDLKDLWGSLGLTVTKQGPDTNALNVLKILKASPIMSGRLWFDEFHNKVFTTLDSKEPRPWTDVDDINLLLRMQNTFGLRKMNLTCVNHAAVSYANSNKRNEAKEWLETLQWDGVSRLKNFFRDVCSSEATAFNESVSVNFWLSMVARVYRPGCKCDNMVILEGPQGIYKSTLLKTIGGQWYSELTEAFGSKDFYGSIQGKLLIEVSELDSFARAEVTTIKRVLSATHDTFRPPYGRNSITVPRIAIFAGTTNEHEYLRDSTGGRRFWPVSTMRINITLAEQLREQYFAEAVQFFKHDMPWHLVPEEEARDLQESRQEQPAWLPVIQAYLERRQLTTISTVDLLTSQDCIGMPIDRVKNYDLKQVASSLKALGWKVKKVKINNSPVKRWFSPEVFDSDL